MGAWQRSAPGAQQTSSMERSRGRSSSGKYKRKLRLTWWYRQLRLVYAQGSQQLAIPHLSLPSISYLRWESLRNAGFQAVVLDKDNTITKPYGKKVESQLLLPLDQCRKVFEGNIALYSNSAGLMAYDHVGTEAEHLESLLGIPVMRHTKKKPAGNVEELENYFGCKASQIVMVGDRYLTDIVFGNLNGMLTVRVSPITQAHEPATVHLARKLEEYLVKRWMKAGFTAPKHPLLAQRTIMFDFAPTPAPPAIHT